MFFQERRFNRLQPHLLSFFLIYERLAGKNSTNIESKIVTKITVGCSKRSGEEWVLFMMKIK
jgi:hypothetical protein